MRKQLKNIIKINFEENNSSYKTIGVIGEFGAGKSTLIEETKGEFERNPNFEVLEISLMSTLVKKEQESYSTNKVENSRSDELSKNVNLLNSIYQLIQYNLLEVSDFPKMYNNSVDKDKEIDFQLRNMYIGIVIALILTILYPNDLFWLDPRLLLYIRVILFISAAFYLGYALLNIIRIKKIKLKSLSVESNNIAIAIDENSNVLNEEQFILGIFYMIDLHASEFDKKNYLFLFEDIDRVGGVISIEFLRELNSRLNILLAPKGIKIVFLCSLRIGLLEKNASKGLNTRSRTKLEKYFSNTLYIKSINNRRYKSFISDVKEVIYSEEELSHYEIDSKQGYRVNELMNEAFREIFELFEPSNLEIYTDYRVYKSFVYDVHYSIVDYLEDVKAGVTGNEDIKNRFSDIILSDFLINASKHASDFIYFYTEIINDIKWYKNVKKIYICEIEKIIQNIEKKIIAKYSVKKNKVFSDREQKFFEIFIKDDFENGRKLSDKSYVYIAVGHEAEEKYFKENNSEFKITYDLHIDFHRAKELYENATSFERQSLKNSIITKPNKSIARDLEEYIEVFGISLQDMVELASNWFEKCDLQKISFIELNILTEKLVNEIVNNSDKEKLKEYIKTTDYTANMLESYEYKKKLDEIGFIVNSYNEKNLSVGEKNEFKKTLEMLNKYSSSYVTKKNIFGTLSEDINQEYKALSIKKKGSKLYMKKMITQILESLQ